MISSVPDATLAELRYLLACLRAVQGDSIKVAELWSFLASLSSHAVSTLIMRQDQKVYSSQINNT